MKRFLLAIILLLLPSCDNNHYRYYCQNPENVKNEYCNSINCKIDRACPEHIFKNDEYKEERRNETDN